MPIETTLPAAPAPGQSDPRFQIHPHAPPRLPSRPIAPLNSKPSSRPGAGAIRLNLHRREWIYDPVDVSKDLKGVQVKGGELLAYVAKPEYRLPQSYLFPEVGIRATYVKTVEAALKSVPGAYEDYLSTTDQLPIAPFADQKDPAIDVFGYRSVAAQGSCPRLFQEAAGNLNPL